MYDLTYFLVSLFIGMLGVLALWVKYHFRQDTRCASTQTKDKKRKDRKTQTNSTETKTVQTETMRFTERITNFDTEQVNSSEIFDNSCEICVPNAEKEAVGYCKICEQFMCLNCCKHHEKISLSENHTLLGKENYQQAKEKNSKIENHLAPVQTYSFKECMGENCYRNYCSMDHSLQAFGIVNVPTSGEICCILQRYTCKDGYKLSQWYQDNVTGNMHKSDILQQGSVANDFCTIQANTNETEDVRKNAVYFTTPNETTVWKYETCTEALNKGPQNSQTNKGDTTKAFYKNGKCYGIAAFDNGLAISLFIPTTYVIPDWQVQYVTFTGMVKQQIYYDNEGKPLFKEPKYLTSNDAQNVLYVSDQGTNAIVALDPKGTVLFKSAHETIKSPKGLTCDDEGNIIVACENKVIQIHKHGTKSRVILSSNEKEPKMLIDVCFNKVSQKLAVVNKSSEVTVFKFLP